MADALLSWTKDPGTVVSYDIAWTLNGAPVSPASVPQSAAGDAGGYSAPYSASNPAALKAGDVVGCSIVSTDAAGQKSSPVTPAAVTVPPQAPPAGPQNVTLTLVP